MRRSWARLRSLSAAQWRVLLQSLVLVPMVELSLKKRGFNRTAAPLVKRSKRDARPATAQEARLIADAVAIVAGRRGVGAKCLGRSLVLWFLLRRRGIDAELVIGAAASVDGVLPAHAWVEVQGEPVNDRTDVRDCFVPLLGARDTTGQHRSSASSSKTRTSTDG